ncbi:MAG: DEAD/DEAH box helicase [Malacoplasma sp.]|nr:DEAD/DEAH box helicase [Malacoplasma sp.]
MNELKDFIVETLNNEFEISELNDLQKEFIPLVYKDSSLILCSPTGTGKTFCYLLPILNQVDLLNNDLQCLIVVATKELLMQINKILAAFKKHNSALNYLAITSKSSDVDLLQLAKNNKYQIIVCLPEKFEEIVKFKNLVTKLKYIVIDEADMTLDLGFFKYINSGFNKIKNLNSIKKIATSATLYETLSIQIAKFFKNCVIFNKNKSIWENKKVDHFVIHYSLNEDKKEVLKKTMELLNPYFGIIFCNTKKTVDDLYTDLYQKNFKILKLHGGLTDRERKNIFSEIKNKNINWLIATDLLSRGIDIDGVSHIISYDLPKEDLWYVHRAGRSGRKNYFGKSYVFNDANSIYQIARLERKGIVWNHLKYSKNNLVVYQFKIRKKQKKETEVDRQIQKAISLADKKVKPNYKKKIKLEIKEIKRKAKRQRIEQLVNEQRIKKYKIESAKKQRMKKELN